MKVFLSHTSRDKDFAARLASDLREAECDVFTYFDAIAPGESIAETIGSAILDSDAVIILLSEESAKSPWVSSEIALARTRWERGEPRRIIPIVIEKSAEIPFFIKDLLYLDLSEEGKYHQNFPRLVKALTEARAPARDAAKGRRARGEMLKAQEAAMILEKEFHAEQAALHQFFISQVTRIAALASLLFALVVMVFMFYTRVNWFLVVFTSLAFFAGMSVPIFLFFRYRRLEVERLARLRDQLQSHLAGSANRREAPDE